MKINKNHVESEWNEKKGEREREAGAWVYVTIINLRLPICPASSSVKWQ